MWGDTVTNNYDGEYFGIRLWEEAERILMKELVKH